LREFHSNDFNHQAVEFVAEGKSSSQSCNYLDDRGHVFKGTVEACTKNILFMVFPWWN